MIDLAPTARHSPKTLAGSLAYGQILCNGLILISWHRSTGDRLQNWLKIVALQSLYGHFWAWCHHKSKNGYKAVALTLAALVLITHPIQAARLSEQLREERPSSGVGADGLDLIPQPIIPEQEPDGQTQIDVKPPKISGDLTQLPAPVALLREKLLEAAITGDLDALDTIFKANKKPVLLGFDAPPDDPIEYWRTNSTDGKGLENLAIMIEILSTDYAHVGAGTETERFVWPYLAEMALDDLTDAQLIDMYKLVSHADFEDMKAFGGYFFFRLAIEPDGTWAYFLSGD